MTDPSRAALLSVSDKRGITELGQALSAAGYLLLSTGGTAVALRAAGLDVVEVSDFTGAAEMMGGRVKTLHPTIHGGILGRRGLDEAVMAERGIVPIDYVVVNLYPFEDTVAKPDCRFEDAIENIDIGGPAMVRSAAKNHASVAVVTDPDDYRRVAASLDDEDAGAQLRFELACKAFAHTAHYDGAIANYLTARSTPDAAPDRFPEVLNRQFQRIDTLRYGENPHQAAAFYRDPASIAKGSLATADFRQGKSLSYNNVVDADAALACVRAFEECTCVIVKHANPCGVGSADTPLQAYEKAYLTDPVSAFGGIIAFNRTLDEATANVIVERQFVEVVIAPAVDDGALQAFAAKPNVRVLVTGESDTNPVWRYQSVSGGLLVQDDDQHVLDVAELEVVSARAPTTTELRDLAFAWRVANYVKSNAIVYCRDGATIGVGAGQMSRVYSARIAAIKAQDASLDVKGSVMASDAFFPFRDGLDNAAEVGVRAVIQPGGSRNDADVIEAADEHDIAMVFTGIRHFRH